MAYDEDVANWRVLPHFPFDNLSLHANLSDVRKRHVQAKGDYLTGGNGGNGEGNDEFLISVISVFSCSIAYITIYRISQHCDFCTATTVCAARFGTFRRNSSQVPLHEAFTYKKGRFQSCSVVPNRVIFVNKCARKLTIPNFYHFGSDSAFRAPKPEPA